MTVLASVVVVLVETACVTTGTASGTLPLRFPSSPAIAGLSVCVGVLGAETCRASFVVALVDAEARRESLGAVLGLWTEELVGVRCSEW